MQCKLRAWYDANNGQKLNKVNAIQIFMFFNKEKTNKPKQDTS
jgi:hypothetical protein